MASTDWTQFDGQLVPKSFNAGYVVLSYVVSFVGAWTTLELVNRRTAMRGYYNWFLLAGSSVSMGGIAIWCMHFIGNRAITLGDGAKGLQIAYSAGYTALSFFLPVIVLFLAFWAVGSNEKVSLIRVGMGGALAGLGIVGMHYLGQAGISNYTCIYDVDKIIGAGVIAVVASVGALTVFFIWRSSWETSWWRRAICAIILAGAVSGMHWLASVGTSYRLRMADSNSVNNISRNATVIVVIVLSVGACLLLMLFTLLAQRRRALSANRAQQVVLAAAVFDKDGRLMVSPEGLLPNRKITNSFIERSFDDVFGISHPVFLWLYRTTRNWSSVSRLLPGMRHHIHRAGLKGSQPGTKTEVSLATEQGAPIDDYSIVFRELFCVAAADLADDLNVSIENVGILFDEIVSTGQKSAPKTKSKRESPASSVDLERNGLPPPVFGRGQLLFLVSRVDRKESEHLQAAGYRFANVQNVLPILARGMQVGAEELATHISDMAAYCGKSKMLKSGIHIACFAVRASIRGGFDVLVRKDARNQLPSMQLPFETMEKWQLDYLRTLDSQNVSAVVKALRHVSKWQLASIKEQTFAMQMLTTLQHLQDAIDDTFFNEALLVAKLIRAPCIGQDEESQPGTANLLTFRLMAPIHSRAPGNKLEFIPLAFFRAQQHVYRNSPDHAVFARQTYREFAPILDVASRSSTSIDTKTMSMKERAYYAVKRVSFHDSKLPDFKVPVYEVRWPEQAHLSNHTPSHQERRPSKLKFWDHDNQLSGRDKGLRDDTSSEKVLFDPNSPQALTFGGIMVSQEVSVDVRDGGDKAMELVELQSPAYSEGGSTRNNSATETQRSASLGHNVTKVLKESEGENFVDELFAFCVEGR